MTNMHKERRSVARVLNEMKGSGRVDVQVCSWVFFVYLFSVAVLEGFGMKVDLMRFLERGDDQ